MCFFFINKCYTEIEMWNNTFGDTLTQSASEKKNGQGAFTE